MKGLRLHNKKNDIDVIVNEGKVYDATTLIELPADHPATIDALNFVETRLDELWDRMGEIDPVWGDIRERLESEWLKHLDALYA